MQTKYNPTFFPFFSSSQNTELTLPAQHIMPNFAQAVPYLIASFVMTSSATTTIDGGYNDPRLVHTTATTTTVGGNTAFAMPSSNTATTTGGGNTALRPRVRNIKHSKKQGSITNTADVDTCMIERFLGKSHYINCQQMDMEVIIACNPTKTLCSYSEQPFPATSSVGCGDSGSFDPATHLTRDPLTGGGRL